MIGAMRASLLVRVPRPYRGASGLEARVVPALRDDEAGPVPVEAAVIEAAARAAVRIVLPVDGRRLDQIGSHPEETELVALELLQRWDPAARALSEHDPRDVARGAAAEDRRSPVGEAVAGEV